MDASRVQLYRAFLALDSVGLQRSQIGEERILGGILVVSFVWITELPGSIGSVWQCMGRVLFKLKVFFCK